MAFFPDINDGKLEEQPPEKKLYTPPAKPVRSPDWNALSIPKDTKGKKLKLFDRPTMDDMHECVPGEAHTCIYCSRDMLV